MSQPRVVAGFCKSAHTLTILLCLSSSGIALSAHAGVPIRGIDIKLGRNPGGNAAARTTTDANGNFAMHGLTPGSYTLTISSGPPCDAKANDKSKTNIITKFVIDHPGITHISATLGNISCAISQDLPLRGVRTPQGLLDITGTIPAEIFAADIGIDVEVGSQGSVTGNISGEP